MITSKIKKDLLQLGLTDNDIKFYVAGLELGLATIPQIAERAGLSRMTGYNIFKVLNQKGLADMDVRSYGQKCKVAKPAKLLTVFEQERRNLDKLATDMPNLIGELNVLYASVPEDLEIHYFRAQEAIAKIWDEALTYSKKGDDLLVLAAVDYTPTLHGRYLEFLEEIMLRSKEKDLHLKMILETSGSYTVARSTIQEIIPESSQRQLGATCDQLIYADHVAYIFPGQELFGITIHNKELANHQAHIFYTLWHQSVESSK
ncbi:MAG: helix-turn-helix domain-containing protein [Patescibacteria group bacterium]|jgi:sugar-specific transcriptional regulator TrmB